MELLKKNSAWMLFVFFLLQSCLPWQKMLFSPEQQEAFFYEQISPLTKGIRGRLRIDGYYIRDDISYGPGEMFLFYEDGTITEFSFKAESKDSIYVPNIDLANNLETWGKKKRWGQTAGAFLLHNDTIIGNTLDYWAWQNRLIRSVFIIINDSTLLLKEQSYLMKKNFLMKEEDARCDYVRNRMYHFVPTHTKPFPDVRSKKYKRLWANKQEWKNYKKRMKQRK